MWVILSTLSRRMFEFASMSITLAPFLPFGPLLVHKWSRRPTMVNSEFGRSFILSYEADMELLSGALA